MDDYTKIEKIGEGKYREPRNVPQFELLSVIEALCTLAIRGTTEIQLTGKISL